MGQRTVAVRLFWISLDWDCIWTAASAAAITPATATSTTLRLLTDWCCSSLLQVAVSKLFARMWWVSACVTTTMAQRFMIAGSCSFVFFFICFIGWGVWNLRLRSLFARLVDLRPHLRDANLLCPYWHPAALSAGGLAPAAGVHCSLWHVGSFLFHLLTSSFSGWVALAVKLLVR